jgi:hypothetical protein
MGCCDSKNQICEANETNRLKLATKKIQNKIDRCKLDPEWHPLRQRIKGGSLVGGSSEYVVLKKNGEKS